MRLFMEVQEVSYSSKAPAQWLRTHTANSLIAEREKNCADLHSYERGQVLMAEIGWVGGLPAFYPDKMYKTSCAASFLNTI
ncbi:hypothetical protein [Klebsiella quasipneumoniae]|uniref:hypothetical protein n=1 Tax=Klebsiella quasipneumoniae TaxID=1463165 RepID=UPI003B6D99BC|nr:hypothetical protein [Klebsiella variicola]